MMTGWPLLFCSFSLCSPSSLSEESTSAKSSLPLTEVQKQGRNTIFNRNQGQDQTSPVQPAQLGVAASAMWKNVSLSVGLTLWRSRLFLSASPWCSADGVWADRRWMKWKSAVTKADQADGEVLCGTGLRAQPKWWYFQLQRKRLFWYSYVRRC